MNYSDLAIDESLKRAVADMGYVTLTPIQEKAIPIVLDGHDVMGAAQTGTGKTAAFSLPILHKLLPEASASMSPARHPVRALILAPTRELADQVAANVKAYARHTPLRSTVVFGGVDMNAQTEELRRGVELLIATPGRLLDHIEAKNTSLAQVRYVVLDEADRMLDIGFLPDLQRILSFLPKERTTLLFSATFSPEIKRLAASYLQSPVLVEVARPNATATNVEQIVYETREGDKRAALKSVLATHGIEQAIIFVNSKLGAARLARSLERDGLNASAMHGDKSQAERLATLDAFKAGTVKLLVATDVAARGLDIVELPAVVNYDIPFNAEDYVHRIGRTGRAGASGLAVSLTTPEDGRSLADIEKLIKRKFEVRRPTLQDERPPRRERRHDDERGAEREHHRPAAERSTGGSFRPARPSADPFFNRPYEPDPNAAPAWEATTPGGVKSTVSPNIRPKRKVAALLGGKQ
ncbi:MAG: DEAD/DEAH box helicase [Betaproteobacteria bacterium]|nr:DEAD/DEAH box helicase [Betaproteobacteria bacterium]MDE2048666.1 DEAD/DEAH box helicase [Betaproteobacteria bacterium]